MTWPGVPADTGPLGTHGSMSSTLSALSKISNHPPAVRKAS